VDLQALYEEGDLSGNVLLQDGDVVNVWDREYNKIFMLGAIMSPGSLTMKKGRITLAEALSDRGNINQFTANPYQIFVIRGGDQPAIYHLASLEPDAMMLADRFPLRPRDLVYVDEADVVRWNKLISMITPTTNTLQSWGYSNFPVFRSQE
jgi:polysaccharide export outer membrane protein